MNVKFHKITSYSWNFQNFTCIFTILVKFDIPFSDLDGKFSLALLQNFLVFNLLPGFFIVIIIDVLQQLQKNKIKWRKNGEKIK